MERFIKRGDGSAMEKTPQREMKFSMSVFYGRERQKQVSVACVTHTSAFADPIRNHFTHKEIVFPMFVTICSDVFSRTI